MSRVLQFLHRCTLISSHGFIEVGHCHIVIIESILSQLENL